MKRRNERALQTVATGLNGHCNGHANGHPVLIPEVLPGRQVEIHADLWPHPLTAEGRELRTVAIPEGSTLEYALDAALPIPLSDIGHALAVTLDGEPVGPADWPGRIVRDGQFLAARVTLRGGGDSDPLQLVLQIAILVAAIYIPTLIPALGVFGAAALGAAIQIGGALILNGLFPPPVPDSASVELPGSPAQVYSLSGGVNVARPYDPLRIVLGEHRIFPHIAAREYTEFRDDDEQFLLQVFSFGIGDLEISELNLGNTLLSSYADVRTHFALPGEDLEIVAIDVDTTAGAVLTDTNWVRRDTPDNTRRIGVDLTGRVFRVDDRGQTIDHDVNVSIRYRRSGNVTWTSSTNAISGDSGDPIRRTYYFDLPSPAGVFEVEVRRTSAPSSDDKIYDDVGFSALRSYQQSEIDRGGDTLLEVEIRASGQLQGRLDRLSAFVRQRIPTWNGMQWSTAQAASSNPAALLRAFAIGWRDSNLRLLAGTGRELDQMDHDNLGAFYDFCEAHTPPLRCNLDLNRPQSAESVESSIAACGRGQISWGTGKFGVVWEDADRVPSNLITPGRIIENSLRVDWVSGEVAEEVVVNYIDPAADWQRRSVRRNMPGIVTPAYTATLNPPGITDSELAAVFCNLFAARQLYFRRRIGWLAGPEASRYRRGDVLFITHDLVSGGVVGRLSGGTAARPILDREVTLVGNSWLLFELANGDLHQSAVSRPPGVVGDTAEVALANPMPASPAVGGVSVGVDDGAGPRDVLWRLYTSAAPPIRVRLMSVEPQTEDRIKLSAVDELAEYHAAATSDLTVPLHLSRFNPPAVVAMLITERLIQAGNGFLVEVQADLTVTGNWTGGVIVVSRGGGPGRTVARMALGEDSARWIEQPSGTISITAIPGSEAYPAGDSLTVSYDILGEFAPPPPPTTFTVVDLDDGTRQYSWEPPEIINLAGILIRYVDAAMSGAAWADMTPLHEGYLTASPHESFDPPAGAWIFAARSLSTQGVEGPDVRTAAITLAAPRRGGGQIYTGDGPPDASLGENIDVYIQSNGHIWRKTTGVWVDTGVDLSAEDGAEIHTGDGPPDQSLGENIDIYIEDNGHIWRKTTGAWVDTGIDITGTSFRELRAFRVRTVTQSAPSRPSSGSYNFDTAVFTPPAGWVADFPTVAAGQVVYGIVATADNAGGSLWAADEATDWSPPEIVNDNGDVNAIYRRYVNGPITGPGASASVPAGWYESPSQVPPGNGAIWVSFGIRRPHQTTFTWSFPVKAEGQDADPADIQRGPAIYQILITATQQAALEAAGSVLPSAFVTLANNATTGDNVTGDFVSFRRSGYASLWAWSGALWRVAEPFFAAEQILAVNLTAIQGDFADLNVTGRLSADHIDADVQNFEPLWRGNQLVRDETWEFTCAKAWRDFDVLQIFYITYNEGHGGSLLVEIDAIPSSYSVEGGGSMRPAFFGNQNANNDGAGLQVRLYNGTLETQIRIYAKLSDEGWIRAINGLKWPSSLSPVTTSAARTQVGDQQDGGGVVITTEQDYVYRLGASIPSAPTGGTGTLNHNPSGWSRSQPNPTSTENVYRASRTETFHDGVFQSATVWGGVTKVADMTGGGMSSRSRTFYRRGATTPSAPTASSFGAYSSVSGWSTSNPGPTTTQNVYRVTLTQYFNHATTQNSSTFDRNEWGSVTLHQNMTGTPPPTNQPPTANAGPDKTISGDAGITTFLSGSGSDPEDGTNLTRGWTFISGPGGTAPNIQSPNGSYTTTVGPFLGGTGAYVFRLTVTDSGGLSGTDDATVNFTQTGK